MKLNKQNFPGARIFKTFIAVFLSLVISRYIFNSAGFYMTVAVILAMKDSPEKTKAYGKNRILGTIIGGLLGYFVLLFVEQTHISDDSFIMICINAFCIFLLLWMSKVRKMDEVEVGMGCVVLFSITLTGLNSSILTYVAYRVLETTIGVIISMVINTFDFEYLRNKWRKLESNKEKTKEIEDELEKEE